MNSPAVSIGPEGDGGAAKIAGGEFTKQCQNLALEKPTLVWGSHLKVGRFFLKVLRGDTIWYRQSRSACVRTFFSHHANQRHVSQNHKWRGVGKLNSDLISSHTIRKVAKNTVFLWRLPQNWGYLSRTLIKQLETYLLYSLLDETRPPLRPDKG